MRSRPVPFSKPSHRYARRRLGRKRVIPKQEELNEHLIWSNRSLGRPLCCSSVAERCGYAPSSRRVADPNLWLRHPRLFVRWLLTKNKHLLAIYSIPTRGFTAVVSVFGGTPPAKPLKCKLCKIRLALRGNGSGRSWADPTGDGCPRISARPVFTGFNLSPRDIIKMSRCQCSRSIAFRFRPSTNRPREIKNPACRASRVGKSRLDSLPACHAPIQGDSGFRPI